MKLSEAVNIGKILKKQCLEVGIPDFETLKREGSKAVWLKIFACDSSACVHRIYALEGAIRGVDKRLLSDETKEDLRAFVRAAKGGA